MRLGSARPFWPIRDGLVHNYDALKRDVSSEVAIIGGGLCGSMVGYHLAEAGVEAVLLDKRDVGYGSTSCSTALVLYEIDVRLSDLIRLRGEEEAVSCYKACRESVFKVEGLIERIQADCGFDRKKSLYLANNAKETAFLKEEHETRQRHGFKLDYLSRKDIEDNFSFSRPAALLSPDAGQLDPYLLTHSLIQSSQALGLKAYDRTAVTKVEPAKRGVLLTTDKGLRIRAKKVVFATGYETPYFLREKIVRLKSTYAIVSEPIARFAGWGFDRCLIWDAGSPYLYLRTTADGRMMIGGEDEDFVNPTRRDRLIPAKARTLLGKAKKMFPKIDIEIGYAWAGTFGETYDSLPYVGEVERYPNSYFALCYGANGTNFAVMAAEIIRDLYLEKDNPDAPLFRFGREELNPSQTYLPLPP